MKRILVFAAVIALLPVLAVAESPSLVSEKKFDFGGKNDQPTGICVDQQNNFLVNGLRDLSNSSLTGASPSIGKYSNNGTMVWNIVDTTKAATSIQNQMAVLANGNIFQTFDGAIQAFSYLKKLGPDGNEIWRKKIDGITYLANWGDTLIAIVQKTSTVRLLDEDGNVLRSFPLGLYFDGYIAPAVRGNFLYVSGVSGEGAILAKFYLPTGEQKWLATVSKMVNNLCAADDDGNVYLGGSRITADTLGIMSHFIAKFDKDGNIVWQQQWFSRGTYETNYENNSQAIAASSAKNAVIVGGTFQKGNIHYGYRSAFLKEFSASSGEPIWEKRWDYEPTAVISGIRGIRFDKNDDVVALGNSYTNAGGNPPNVCYLQKYEIDKVLDAVREWKDLTPNDFRLSQNYPNPFNPRTTIEFSLPKRSTVKITVMNLLGQTIETLLAEDLLAGVHRTE
ncbi:MAG: PQQ-binding-like beta-propeller repeat protein, partial [Candidatus Jorgensenbacteria bacterium]